jgi:hypothetical protein
MPSYKKKLPNETILVLIVMMGYQYVMIVVGNVKIIMIMSGHVSVIIWIHDVKQC